jgi:GntP family gluconate:H+ symporter
LAIGAGSLVFCWMNDSGFWVVARMSVWSEIEALKLWTVTAAAAGVAAFLVTVLFALLLPGAFG